MLSTNNTTSAVESSYFNNAMSNYSDSLSIEIAILQRRILLPILPKEIIGEKVLNAYNYLGYEYRTKDQFYTDVLGNFYVTMLMPLIKNGKSTEMKHAALNTSNILNKENAGINVKEYKEHNYINLVIPKYIVCNFTKEIPKGTQFITCYIGGLSSLSNIKIIGVGEIGKYRMKIESPISCVGMKQEDVIALVRKDIKDLNDEYRTVLKEEKAEYGNTIFSMGATSDHIAKVDEGVYS